MPAISPTPPPPEVLAAAVARLAELEARHDAGSDERHRAVVTAIDGLRGDVGAVRDDLRELRDGLRQVEAEVRPPPPAATWREVVAKVLAGRLGQRVLLVIVVAMSLPVSLALTVAAWREPATVICLLDADTSDCPRRVNDQP